MTEVSKRVGLLYNGGGRFNSVQGVRRVDPIPEEVRKFLDGNIDSVDQLEILRVLGEHPEREWAAGDLAHEVQTNAQNLSAHLVVLHARGLLTQISRGTEVFCRYGAATPALEAGLTRLLQTYRERPVTMIRLVSSRTTQVIKSFADAFRLRKEG